MGNEVRRDGTRQDRLRAVLRGGEVRECRVGERVSEEKLFVPSTDGDGEKGKGTVCEEVFEW